MDLITLPSVVMGAGPIGLAAAHLLARGQTPLVLEAGATGGANLWAWGVVRFFAAWRYSIDAAAPALPEAHGWSAPDPDDYPAGRELADRYSGTMFLHWMPVH